MWRSVGHEDFGIMWLKLKVASWLPPLLMIVQGDVEDELNRVWNLILELSQQLDENRAATAELRAQADALKARTNRTSTYTSPCLTASPSDCSYALGYRLPFETI